MSLMATIGSDPSSESDSDYGPSAPTNNINNRKRKRSEDEEKRFPSLHKKQKDNDIWLNKLPSSQWYEYSWMHKKTVSYVGMAPNYDFLITTSTDGIIKFWKKKEIGIEFVKEYRGHSDYIQCMDISKDGTLLITIGNDKRCSIFDIVTFDLILKFELTYFAGICCWINNAQLIITEKNQSIIRIYKPKKNVIKNIITSIHSESTTILTIKYNKKYNCCVSTDLIGNIEFWSTSEPFERAKNLSFEYLMETDLILYKKDKIIPTAISISNNYELIAITSNDNFIRLFRFKNGKLLFELNENIGEYLRNNSLIYKIDSIGFGKVVAVERQINKELNDNIYNNDKEWLIRNIVFDSNDKHILYSTMMGIKVINTKNGSLSRLIGKEERNVTFLNIALFQGCPNIKYQNIIGSNINKELSDPLIFVSGYKTNRFYMFSNRRNKTDEHRDIQNEKPTRMHAKIATNATHRTLGINAIMRTTFGDIYIKLFPQIVPKTVENFTVHSINGYYNNCIFHRVIRGFCIQTGDPKGDSTGGESIWGNVFDDEFHRSLKHDRPGTVSMANAGLNTSGSQFFITTTEAKWLDNKHTIFGRVTKGMDVVQAIECVKCDKVTKKPVQPIKIINISVEKI